MMFPLIAVDIGNNRSKFGWFAGEVGDRLPVPERTVALANGDELEGLAKWLGDAPAGLRWWIGSVNRPAATRLIEWLRDHRPDDPITLLAAGDLPLRVALPRPDMVGIDRLLDAAAANRLREPGRPAVVVDVGTAITVDLVSADGAFQGGAILPGIAMSAQALHTFTDLLPLIDVSELDCPPPALGKDTVAAMQSGLFWGTLGAIRELVDRLAAGTSAGAEVFLTGGAGSVVADLLGPAARHVPHLTLAGIALAAHRVLRPVL
ncbi:MAG: type III pantothenate kinase [Thermoguttaceae bacterium]|jgi:type III pantothenate kinase|nr:type III pantothenate kinase [Thermoguttaceae bacterium]